MKLDDLLATLNESIIANGGTSQLAAKVTNDLRKAQEDEKADRGKAPKTKTQHAILVSDPEGRLTGMELIGWVVAMEEAAPPQAAHSRIVEAVNNYNNSRKGRRQPLTKLGEAMTVLRGKWLKRDREGEKVQIKTRDPVAIQAVTNTLQQ